MASVVYFCCVNVFLYKDECRTERAANLRIELDLLTAGES